MKIKNLLLLILPIAILACGTSGFPAPAPSALPVLTQPLSTSPVFTAIPTLTSVPETNPSTGSLLSQTVTIQSTPFSESSNAPLYTITAQTPYLQGSDDPRVGAFNERAKQIVQNGIDDFKNNVISQASNPPISAGSSFDLQYAIVGQHGDFWSIKFNIYFYADGAAHPAHGSITLNYDLEKGKEITLDELFLPNSNYLQAISDYAKAQLATRDIGFDMFSDGAAPLPENYQQWNVSDNGLVITFDEYQVAPYAAGPQEVVLPFEELGQFLDHQSSIAPFLP